MCRGIVSLFPYPFEWRSIIPTSIWMQKSASIQPRTSPVKLKLTCGKHRHEKIPYRYIGILIIFRASMPERKIPVDPGLGRHHVSSRRGSPSLRLALAAPRRSGRRCCASSRSANWHPRSFVGGAPRGARVLLQWVSYFRTRGQQMKIPIAAVRTSPDSSY